MGFININGQQVHTSNISTSTSSNTTISGGSNIYTTTSSGNFAIYSQKAKYNILGEEFEIDGYQDPTISMIISSINIMGKPFYDDLKKQNLHLPEEIDNFLQEKFRILERDSKIDSVIGK
jgi:hypothetical protein